MKRLNGKAIFSIPIALAVAVSSIATWIDWYKNPSGLFRNSAGTSWSIVFETAVSWFFPALLVAAVGQAIWILATDR